MSITDYTNGTYTVSGTVTAGRADLFRIDHKNGGSQNNYHMATLVSGSRSQLERFERDCHRIVDALAALDNKTE